jgi:hypothetical protein
MLETAEHAVTTSTEVQAAIDRHFAAFQALVGCARESLLQGKHDQCAAYIQTAGHHAWYHPTGLLACPELESMLTQIGSALAPRARATARIAPVPPRRVLHVLTEAYGVGGHTRFVWRWIRADADRSHSVVLTRQQDCGVPRSLKAAAEGTGGKLYFLDRRPGGLLARAQALRRLAARADHVILHTHPNDVVPLIAFAGRGQTPPVTLMNLNDHVFWLGASLVDQVAQLRESGRELAQQRRGLSESRCPLLPIPIEVRPRPKQGGEAKRKLGLSEETIVLFSVASAYKYSALPGQHFTDVLLPVVQKHPNVMLLVIGPEERGEWASAARQAGGRVTVFGKRADTELFFRAADIYLDSFPLNSLTSALEAGSYGTPIVSYCVGSADAEVLCTDDVGLPNLIIRGHCVDDYRSQVSRLIEDAEFRAKLGELTRQGIIACHAEGGWNRLLEELYVRGAQASSTPAPQENAVRRRVTELDIQLAGVFAISGWSRDFTTIILNYVALFPLGARIGIWRDIFHSNWRSLPAFTLADWQKTGLRLLWQRS